LKGGTDSATPSVNGVIARNLLRLSSLLEDETYRKLAQATAHTFAVEILQHPFLFVNLLDVIVGLEMGTRNVTGVVATDSLTGFPGKEGVMERVRTEAGLAASSTSTATVALVDVRSPSEAVVPSAWLRSRNPLFKDLTPGSPPKNFLLVCETGRCRVIDL
jgi:uncharacterized protein YyaL (SSP411 family)